MVLITIILGSLTASSQTGTQADTNHMRLPVGVMKSIAQDLLRKDSLEEENKLLWKNAEILTNNLRLKDVLIIQKDSIISVKNSLLVSKDTIISLKDEQIQKVSSLNKDLEKHIKRNKVKFKISTISSTIVVIGLTLLQLLR